MDKKDIRNTLLLIIPALVCILVFFLPNGWQEQLVLNLNNLNLWSWFTYIFVHQNAMHLILNMVSFVIPTIFAYFVLRKIEENRIIKLTYSNLFIVPLITLFLTILFRNMGLFPLQLINSKGFSGISSASIGLLGFALSRRIQMLWLRDNKSSTLLNLCYYFFMPVLGILSYNLSWKLSAVAFILWILLILKILFFSEDRKNKNKKNSQSKRELLFLGVGLAILFIGSLMLVPKTIIANGSVVNSMAHLIGLVIGFWLPFFVTAYKKVK